MPVKIQHSPKSGLLCISLLKGSSDGLCLPTYMRFLDKWNTSLLAPLKHRNSLMLLDVGLKSPRKGEGFQWIVNRHKIRGISNDKPRGLQCAEKKGGGQLWY